VLALFLAAATWATWPSADGVNLATCEPNGILARLSAIIHQDRFWQAQLDDIRLRAARAENWDRNQEEARAKIDAVLEAARKRMEDVYEKHPSLAPSPEQRAADRLRAVADEIEHAEGAKIMSDFNMKQLAMLRLCEDAVAAMLH
jgi:hypothetical protein